MSEPQIAWDTPQTSSAAPPQIAWDTPQTSSAAPPQIKWDDEQPAPPQIKWDDEQPAPKTGLGMGGEPLSDRTIPNARLRNLPNPAANETSGAGALYHGAKTGLLLGSIPASLEATIPGLIRGGIGATAGSYGGRKIAQAAGAGEMGQEVAGDIGGLAGGALSETSVKPVLRGVGKIATAAGNSVDPDLAGIISPRAGSALRYASKLGRVATKLGSDKPVYPGAPFPEDAPTGEFVDTPPSQQAHGPQIVRRAEIVQPKMLSESASVARDLPYRYGPGEIQPEEVGAPDTSHLAVRVAPRGNGRLLGGRVEPSTPYRIGPGEIQPEDVNAPDENVLAGRQGVRIARPAPQTSPKLLPAGAAGSMVESVEAAPASPAPEIAKPAKIGELLERGLGNEAPPKIIPGKPIYQGPRPLPRPAATAEAPAIPKGFTPVESSAIRAYHYDEPTQTFSAQMNNGAIHKWSGVEPEDAEAFRNADSKGKALSVLRNRPGVTGVGADYGNGFIARKPSIRSADPMETIHQNAEDFAEQMRNSKGGEEEEEDLIPKLKASIAAANKAKAARIARPN